MFESTVEVGGYDPGISRERRRSATVLRMKVNRGVTGESEWKGGACRKTREMVILYVRHGRHHAERRDGEYIRGMLHGGSPGSRDGGCPPLRTGALDQKDNGARGE